MDEIPSSNRPSRFRLTSLVLLAVLLLAVLGIWAQQYLTRRYAVVAPPDPLKPKARAAIAAIRIDSQAKQQAFPRENEPRSRAGYDLRLECFFHAQHQIEQKTAAHLSKDFPELEEILKSEDPRPYKDAIPPLLQRLLDAAKDASPERKPLLLLATDFIAGRLQLPMEHPASPQLQQRLDALAARGLTYRWPELDGYWAYQSDVLWRLWREYPATEAGEDAFVLLLSRGWETTSCCGQGSDQFRTVIREGEEFLAKLPQSPHRLNVAYLLGQAYETWWSLSLISEREEGDPLPAPYREGAGAAREKAIAYYREVLAGASDGPEAKCSRKPLEMLQANQDTHQRSFYCYCD